MSDLDYIDSLVDECLGANNLSDDTSRGAGGDACGYAGDTAMAAAARLYGAVSRGGGGLSNVSSNMPSAAAEPSYQPPPSVHHDPSTIGDAADVGTGAEELAGQEFGHWKGTGGSGNATLRRIQLWEERRQMRRALQQQEARDRVAQECSFRPNIAAARASVHKQRLAARAQRFGTARAEEGRAWGEGADDAVYEDLLGPSRLYKDNVAWGYYSFIDRLAYARERQREQKEYEEKFFQLKDPDVRRRGPTIPQPFELGTIHRRRLPADSKGERGPDSRFILGTSTGVAGIGSAVSATTLNNNATIRQVAAKLRRQEADFYNPEGAEAPGCDGGFDLNDISNSYKFKYDLALHDGRGGTVLAAPPIPNGLFSLQSSSLLLESTGALRNRPTYHDTLLNNLDVPNSTGGAPQGAAPPVDGSSSDSLILHNVPDIQAARGARAISPDSSSDGLERLQQHISKGLDPLQGAAAQSSNKASRPNNGRPSHISGGVIQLSEDDNSDMKDDSLSDYI